VARLKRVVLIGDHHQLPPVVKNMAFQKFSHLDQSLFTRFVRLGTPYIQLNAQVRPRGPAVLARGRHQLCACFVHAAVRARASHRVCGRAAAGEQGRARPSLAKLYNWRYHQLGDLPNVTGGPAFLRANPGFALDFQFVDVPDYQGHGESAPMPHFYQARGLLASEDLCGLPPAPPCLRRAGPDRGRAAGMRLACKPGADIEPRHGHPSLLREAAPAAARGEAVVRRAQNLGEAEMVVSVYMYMRLRGYPAAQISILSPYNGQVALLRDVVERRCVQHPAFGRPHKVRARVVAQALLGRLLNRLAGPDVTRGGVRAQVATVDKYQGQQNEYVLLSLTRTRAVGHIRDVRRLVVAMSRARLGLYVFGRAALFANCYELQPTFTQLLARPTQLLLHPSETVAVRRHAWCDAMRAGSWFARELYKVEAS